MRGVREEEGPSRGRCLEVYSGRDPPSARFVKVWT